MFMVYVFAMEFEGSLPRCGLSSHAALAWLQVVVYTWLIDALSMLCLW